NALFSPDLAAGRSAGAAQQVDFTSEQVTLQLRKLRQAMQIAHAAIIREQNVPASAHQLVRVFGRLENLFQGTGFAELWSIFAGVAERSEEHTSELQSRENLVCRLLHENKSTKLRN